MNKIVKGILLIVGVIFTAAQAGNVDWASTLISAICVGLGYFAKNVWFSSVSEDGVFDWRDIASALIIAIVTSVGQSVSTLVINGVVDWILLGKTVLAVVITYFTATYFSPATK